MLKMEDFSNINIEVLGSEQNYGPMSKLPQVMSLLQLTLEYITKRYLYNFDPIKPHFYIVKLGFTGVYLFFSYFCSKT